MKTMTVFGDLDIISMGQQIRAAREAQGLSQEQVAWRANIRAALVSEVEGGKRRGVRVDTLYRLCQVLGLSADVLLGLRRDDTTEAAAIPLDHMTDADLVTMIIEAQACRDEALRQAVLVEMGRRKKAAV